MDKVFHPGIYLKDYINELKITNEEFSNKLDISNADLSLILEGKKSITKDIALKISNLLGTSVDVWVNLQNQYDDYKLEHN